MVLWDAGLKRQLKSDRIKRLQEKSAPEGQGFFSATHTAKQTPLGPAHESTLSLLTWKDEGRWGPGALGPPFSIPSG